MNCELGSTNVRIWQWSTFIHAHPWFTPMFCLVAQIICCWLITNTHTHTHTLASFCKQPFCTNTTHTIPFKRRSRPRQSSRRSHPRQSSRRSHPWQSSRRSHPWQSSRRSQPRRSSRSAGSNGKRKSKSRITGRVDALLHGGQICHPVTTSFAVQTNTVNRHNPQSQQLAK